MDKENIIDLITFYAHFATYESVIEARQELPKLWADRRQEVVVWLSKKRII